MTNNTQNTTSNLPWSFTCEPEDYYAWIAAIDNAPETRGMVEVEDPEPEALLWPEDFDEDGEVIIAPAEWSPYV